MKPLPLLTARVAAFLLCLIFAVAGRSAENRPPQSANSVLTPNAETFLIADGKIAGVMLDGKPATATLRNIVDELGRRFPDANITLSPGLEGITIQNLKLRVTRSPGALDHALHALSEASGRRFVTRPFGANEVLIYPLEAATTRRKAEVFNLSHFLGAGRAWRLSVDIRRLEAELAVHRKKFTEEHPSVVALGTELDILKLKLAREQGLPKNESDDLLEHISKTVLTTLLLLNPDEKPPEFQFHRGSNLLVVVGTEDAADVTRKVIAALEKEPR